MAYVDMRECLFYFNFFSSSSVFSNSDCNECERKARVGASERESAEKKLRSRKKKQSTAKQQQQKRFNNQHQLRVG